MKINKEWAQENRIINLEIANARMDLKEAKQAYAYDMKTLREEIAKGATEWNCDTINNMALCAQDRAKEIKDYEQIIADLKEKQAVNLWRKYSD